MSSEMHFHILTLFPEMVEEGLNTSILGKAAEKGCISLEAVNIRDYTVNKHKKVDDYPYGGGAGMLMQAQPVYDSFQAVCSRIRERKAAERETENADRADTPRVIYVTPQGRVFNQQMAQELSGEEDLIFLCGHYEGIDERVLEAIVTDYVSIGDYVLTGGELPAMVMVDAISRLVPGVLKNEESAEYESFHDHLLEYPQYTRPEIWQGRRVPEILLSGDHRKVERWRLEQSEERTRLRRPDLYAVYSRQADALSYLMKDKLSHMDMIEVIRRKQAELLYADENGVLLYDRPSRSWMLSAGDEDMGERLLSLVPRQTDGQYFAVHQDYVMKSVCRRFGKTRVSECLQIVYTRKLPPGTEGISGPESTPEGGPVPYQIRALGEEDLEVVHAGYHTLHSREYLLERIRAGEMFGAFAEGKLAAFAGLHAEGSIGMLEVREEYRRKGLGEAMEKHLIRFVLSRGQVPFGQIFAGNEASLQLARKLGLKLARGRIYWIS